MVNSGRVARRYHDLTVHSPDSVRASGHTLALGKRAFYQQLPLDRPAAYDVAQRVMVENAQTTDAQEGMRAFLEKRPACWTG